MSTKSNSATDGNAAKEAGPSCEELLGNILTDIHDMLDFVRADGKTTIPEELRNQISELCREETDSSKPVAGEIKTGAAAAPVGDIPSKLSLAMEVHGKLSQIVQPANPRTIRASRLTGKYKFFADNTTVKLLLLASVLSLVVFMIVAGGQATIVVQAEMEGAQGNTNAAAGTWNGQSTNSPAQVKSSNPSAPVSYMSSKTWVKASMDILMILAAASLGSAFYGLFTAHKYLVNCTFDPKYHQVYLIRYVLGLTSGTILGFFGRDLVSDFNKKQLSAAVLALVGGYAAEAVSQILQRFAETLVTVVRGSNTDELQAKEGELKTKAKQQEMQMKTELLKGVQKAKEVALTTSGADSDITKEIQKTIDALSK